MFVWTILDHFGPVHFPTVPHNCGWEGCLSLRSGNSLRGKRFRMVKTKGMRQWFENMFFMPSGSSTRTMRSDSLSQERSAPQTLDWGARKGGFGLGVLWQWRCCDEGGEFLWEIHRLIAWPSVCFCIQSLKQRLKGHSLTLTMSHSHPFSAHFLIPRLCRADLGWNFCFDLANFRQIAHKSKCLNEFFQLFFPQIFRPCFSRVFNPPSQVHPPKFMPKIVDIPLQFQISEAIFRAIFLLTVETDTFMKSWQHTPLLENLPFWDADADKKKARHWPNKGVKN